MNKNKRVKNIVAAMKANKQIKAAKESLKPMNIVKGAAKGTVRDIVKFTTGLGKGGAATVALKPIARKIGTSTGYMLRGAVANMKDAMKNKGMAPRRDYAKWNENIKKGTPRENLK